MKKNIIALLIGLVIGIIICFMFIKIDKIEKKVSNINNILTEQYGNN